MKRCLIIICALTLLCIPALAQDNKYNQPTLYAMSLLTEVCGYTQEEAEAFDYSITETDAQWQVHFSPKDHPEWVYTGSFHKTDGTFLEASSPFQTSYTKYPGENSIRDTLRAALQEGWFVTWDDAARTALRDKMISGGIDLNYALHAGITDGDYTAAQAVDDFFLSCYGDRYEWSPAVSQWQISVLNTCGLTLTKAAPDLSSRQGIQTRTVKNSMMQLNVTVTEYLGDTPDALTQAFSHPLLTGWESLSGAMLSCERIGENIQATDRGLAAFGKGDERLLVMLIRGPKDTEWRIIPVGEQALLRNRDFYITANADKFEFTIEYPISGVESESFRCELIAVGSEDAPMRLLKLLEYRYDNHATGSIILVKSSLRPTDGTPFWYHVTTYTPGQPTQREIIPALATSYLDLIDVELFPKNADACRQAAMNGPKIPYDYGVISGVHLRSKPSSRSDDLGTYASSALVKVLETLPGDPMPWYRVRIGQTEGYMSSNYVRFETTEDKINALSQYTPLKVAKATMAIELKSGTGWTDKKIMDLPQGTKMHVVAATGDWLHVIIPQGQISWIMDIEGTGGYVKADDVVQAASSIQLDWLE